MYKDKVAFSKVTDELLEIYIHTHAHARTHIHTHTEGSRTNDVLELYLNRGGLNGEVFSHHRERHIEYTVYLQTKTSTLTQLHCRI